MRKPVHVIHCDRCEEEIKQAEVLPDGTKEAPAYYRLVTGTGIEEQEKKLDHLCERCKREVEILDERIFSDVRVHKTAAEGGGSDPEGESEPKTTTKTETKGAANA